MTNMSRNIADVDVCVVGSGSAGSTTAIAAARGGASAGEGATGAVRDVARDALRAPLAADGAIVGLAAESRT
jgi:glycine/D-amino acid oxidase-like deaminating enzyme